MHWHNCGIKVFVAEHVVDLKIDYCKANQFNGDQRWGSHVKVQSASFQKKLL